MNKRGAANRRRAIDAAVLMVTPLDKAAPN
jgi:hypothetical protein